jgi:SAM-dependent methyltransferase
MSISRLNKRIHFIRHIDYLFKVIADIFGRGDVEKICTCCGYQGRFDTTGHPPRYGCLCPVCGSLERHRLLVLADRKENFFTEKEVLHFAPEAILSQVIASRAKRYVTADITPGRADLVLNIENVDQPDASWDVVVCSHVLEHVDDHLALSEINRILRPGGKLVCMTPVIEGWETTYEDPKINAEQDRQWHFGQTDHVRYYGRDIRDRLKNAGFEIIEYTAYGSDVVAYGLLRGEKVFVCKK